MSDIDELLTLVPSPSSDPDAASLPDGQMPDVSRLLRGVRITYLATLWGTEPRRIEKKLAKCPVMRWESHKGRDVPVYDFVTACAYLVEPKIDMRTWIKSQTSLSLPPMINKAFWEAERTRMRVMAEAGQYWHSADVVAFLGRLAMLIKDTTLLWSEDLPDKVDLSTENHQALRRMVDMLLTQIRTEIEKAADEGQIRPVAATIEREIEAGGIDDGADASDA